MNQNQSQLSKTPICDQLEESRINLSTQSPSDAAAAYHSCLRLAKTFEDALRKIDSSTSFYEMKEITKQVLDA